MSSQAKMKQIRFAVAIIKNDLTGMKNCVDDWFEVCTAGIPAEIFDELEEELLN